MKSYVVVTAGNSGITESVLESVFQERRYPIREQVWAVAGEHETAESVYEALATEVPESDLGSVVIVNVDDYYGLFDKALWNRLWAWNREKRDLD